jgi:branched-chain amino acid transport system ATP-binding protein
VTTLAVERLSVSYGPIKAIENLDIEAPPGRVTCVLGRNGAGKTTLFRSLMGLIRAHSGRIMLDGRDVEGLPPWDRVREGMALVPEGSGVAATLSVRDNLKLGAFIHRPRRAEFEEAAEPLLEDFPVLRDRLDDTAGNLSGGQRQMVAIARALMARPKVLLLDEPSFGLGPLIVRQVLEALRDVAASGVAVFLSEQNASVALRHADYAYVLDQGRLALEGDTASVRDNPDTAKHLFV